MPQNVTLVGNRVTADVVSEDGVIVGYGGPLIQYNYCPHKKEVMLTQKHKERTPYDVKDWSNVSTNQGCQRLLANN